VVASSAGPVADFQPAADALAGRVILVVGAHGALGEAAARQCAAAGARVVLLGRRSPRLGRVYDAIEASGGPAPAIYPLDLEGAGPADYDQLAETIEREYGRLDGILHAAAEFGGLMTLSATAPEDLIRAMHVNLTAPLLLTRACLPLLTRADDASVVFLLDDLDAVGRAHWGGYGLAKHALAGAVRILGDELEHSPVRVHGLQPGPMRTPLRARAWFGEDPARWPPAAAYAPACVWLLSPAAAGQRGRITAVRA
jgi:NAD(P)-dependent dehydrogenase (short-subunit alcohol dehydrogenase family)